MAPPTADLNLGAQVGLSHTSTGNVGLSRIMGAMNIPMPTLSMMQKHANYVGDHIVHENQKDLKDIRLNLKKVNVMKGLPEESPINIETDARYNNPIYSGIGKTPFQAATQVTSLIVEGSTMKKQIISCNVKSKLCANARRHERETKQSVTCPDHPRKCTANLPMEAVPGMQM